MKYDIISQQASWVNMKPTVLITNRQGCVPWCILSAVPYLRLELKPVTVTLYLLVIENTVSKLKIKLIETDKFQPRVSYNGCSCDKL